MPGYYGGTGWSNPGASLGVGLNSGADFASKVIDNARAKQ